MDSYVVVLAGFGVIVLLTAWLPMLMKELPLSLPMACVGLGAAVFAIPGLPGITPHPSDAPALTERLVELVVIVALMGAGLKLDRPVFTLAARPVWQLLAFAMPLTIAALAALGVGLLGLALPAALLLAASLAPTDPVLASDVQVGPPGGGAEDEVRFTLTAEAGLNDGLAFPFVYLAIGLSTAAAGGTFAVLGEWVAIAVAWKIAAGAAIGWAVGRGLGWITFRLPNRARLSRTGDGFVALGITAVSYGLAEMANGYGFIAVFVAALTFRSVERDHHYHGKLHEFMEQLERLLMMILLVLFGGAISDGGLFAALDWQGVAFALLAVFLVRPLAGWVSLAGALPTRSERAVVAFFGIRGLGSAYYLAYGLVHGDFLAEAEPLWAALGLVVLISVVLHGATVTPVMGWLDRRRCDRAADAG